MIFESFAKNQLQVLPDIGIGYYFTSSLPLSSKKISKEGNLVRISLVDKFTKLDVLDVGTNDFISLRKNAKGYSTEVDDVNWLIENKLYRHPFKGASALTFWNTFHLINDHRLFLSGADEYVFISCPIYEGVEEMKKINGHFWYFTTNGLVNFMKPFGFEVQEINWMEKNYVKENIATFVFKRCDDLE